MGVPLAALAINTQGPSPLETVGKIVQLKSLIGQTQHAQRMQPIEEQQAILAEQQQRIQEQGQEDFNSAYQSARKQWQPNPKTGRYENSDLLDLIEKNGNTAYTEQAVTKSRADLLKLAETTSQTIKNDAEAEAANFATHSKKMELLSGDIDSIRSLPPEQQGAALQTVLQNRVKDGTISSAEASQYAGAKPEQLEDIQKHLLGSKTFFDNAKTQAETFKANQDAELAKMKANQLKQQESSGGAVGTGLDVQEANSWLKNHPGKDLSDYQDYIKSLPIRVQSGLLSDQAKQMAAETYAATGALPAGMRSPAMSAGILNAAAAGPGGAPNIAANKAAYGANAASLKQIQETFDNVNAFENTAGKNLDLFLKQADKVSDAGSKFLNTPLRLITRDMVGTADMAAFDAARTTALTEIAKVLNSPKGAGVLSDSARAEAEGLIGKNATLASIRSAANILKQDMANRHQAYADQIEAIKGRISGKASTTEHKPGGQATGLREGQTGTGSDGKKYIVKGGVWQPQ